MPKIESGTYTGIASRVQQAFSYDRVQSQLVVTNNSTTEKIVVSVSDEERALAPSEVYTFNEEFKVFNIKTKTKTGTASFTAVSSGSVSEVKANNANLESLTIKTHGINTHDDTDPANITIGYQLGSDGLPAVNATYSIIKAKVYKNKSYTLVRVNSQGTLYVGAASSRVAFQDLDGKMVTVLNNNANTIVDAPCDGYVTFQYQSIVLANKDYMCIENPVVNATLYSGTGYTAVYTSAYIPYNTLVTVGSVKTLNEYGNSLYPWAGKVWAGYGDSITALTDWSSYVTNYHRFLLFYNRGIGGQKYAWGTGGGSTCFLNADGSLNSRDDTTNKDTYTGTPPTGTTVVRGCFCSWDRITKMFPSSIKNGIHLVYMMGGTNDAEDATAPTWVPDDATDTEWKASTYYATYGGDFNIATLQGGVASAIMKLQAWMPNAVIVLGTPLSGRGDTGALKPSLGTTEYTKTTQILNPAGMAGIPVINVNRTVGINGLNRTTYIADTVHPDTDKGKMMLGRAVAGGLQGILPMLSFV